MTWSPVGLAARDIAPDGYRLDRLVRPLGHVERTLANAIDALSACRVRRGAGLGVHADGPPIVGIVVAMAAPMPVGWVKAVCRVVEVVDRPDRFGFAYETLPVHPEQDEESRTLVRGLDDQVVFEIVAVSRPRYPCARACLPLAPRLQRSATDRFPDSLNAAVK